MDRRIWVAAACAFLMACGGGGGGGGGEPIAPAPPAPPAPAPAPVAPPVTPDSLSDWQTHQGSAAHRGYVPLTLDASRFALAWQWQRDPPADPIGGINALVTSAGKVFVSHDVYFGDGVLYALDESTGAQVWRASFGQVPAMGPPAVAAGRVFVPTTGHEYTAVWSFDAGNGRFLQKSEFEAQWPNAQAPTVYGSQVFVGGGYYGGMTYAFDTASGARLWVADTPGIWDQFTPAVDSAYVYHYSGSGLAVIDRAAGSVLATIADPFGNTNTSYHGAPLIGSRGNVIAYSGGTYSGRASSSTEPVEPRVLSSFDLAGRRIAWRSQNTYMTAPALARGVVYVGSNRSPALHGLDEATGQVIWSWTVPGNLANEGFHRNVVVTDNLVFASSSSAVYAIDIATRQAVWSYPRPGMLALSADATLLIATGATASDGGVVAIRLR